MNKTIATGIALFALGAGGAYLVLPEGGGGDKPAAASDTADTTEATTPRTTTPRTTTPRISSERAFADEILAHIDLLDEGADAFSNVGNAIERMDIVEAAAYASQGAAVFGELRDIALGAPGRDTSIGLLTLNAFEVCEEALDMASTSLTSFDVVRVQAATARIDDCNDAIVDATTAVQAAS